ncbi:Membrane-bound lytic murein transglycosylase B precursor [hydrothermal vent metagenome]|uniref:Membrane-bound lytic murein transglycosylase B n=1 Tax=hydrothermal vent metagenome TaxID=652676 RepID=A0A1W1EF64_9ZZZZ
MKIFKLILLTILIPFLLLANDDRPPVKYNYMAKQEVKSFINMMVKKYHFKRSYMNSVMKSAKLDRDTLARYTGKFKKNTTVGSWERFKLHVVNPKTFSEAKRFKRKYYRTLKKAERVYGVDMNYIVGFLGVESRFGTYTGDYSVLDALATLAFHRNRMQKFFKSELKHLFLFAREKGYDIRRIEGSFAGAMGCVQQVPSIARKHRSDFNGDGKTDPWDVEDCIGSIASFMHKNGWKNGRVVVVPTKFKGKRFKKLKTSHRRTIAVKSIYKAGVKPTKHFNESRAYLLKTRNRTHDDIWMGGRNFKVLTKYNNSSSYGIAIHLIAQEVK